MPIGFSDLLKTTAQLDNNLTKGIVSTDDTYGGVRSKIDDWTDLHLSTYNDGSGYTFQDDGTSAAPGHFKEYSTMFYVADGRALVQNDSASGTYITLDPATGEYDPSGTKFEVASGTAEPEFWVLDDATQVGGTGSGTDKLPKFTISGSDGSYEAIPAGYQKLQVLTNAVSGSTGLEASDLDVTTAVNATTYSIALSDQSNGNDFDGIYIDSTFQFTHNDGSADVFETESIKVGTGSGNAEIYSDGNYDLILKTGNATTGKVQIVDGSNGNILLEPNGSGEVVVGNSGASGKITTGGSQDLVLDTNGGTNSSTLTIVDGANGDLKFAPNGSGKMMLGSGSAAAYITTNGAYDLRLETNDGTNSGIIQIVDGANGNILLKPNGTGKSMIGSSGAAAYLTSNGSHDLVLETNGGTNSGSITITDGANGNITLNPNGTGKVKISGDLEVTGDVVQQDSTTVVFEDSYLNLNVPMVAGTYTDGNYTTDSGFYFTRTVAGNAITKYAGFNYDASQDVETNDYDATNADYNSYGSFRFTPISESNTGAVGNADNVIALKFDNTVTNTQVDQADGETDMNAQHEANADSKRSLGSIAKCRINITNTTDNGDSGTDPNTNYAPDTAWENGYPIKHNLATKGVYVVAIKDPAGTPIPVFCKWEIIDHASVRVYLGKVANDETYDILVMG